MDARAFCEFAADCLRSISGEASQRSALSRAYYAVYHASSLYISERGIPLADGHGDHERVIRTMQNLFDATHSTEIQSLWNLRSWRMQADYTLNTPPKIREPAFAVSTAERILEWIGSLPRLQQD